MDLSKLSLDELIALETEKVAAFNALKASTGLTIKQVAEAKGLAAEIVEIRTTKAALEDEQPASEEALAELAELSVDEEEEEGAESEGDEAEAEGAEAGDEAEGTAEAAAEAEVAKTEKPAAPAKKAAAKGKVAALAAKTERPAKPAEDPTPGYTITAAADTGFAAGASVSLLDMGEAAIKRLSGMPVPNGTGETEDPRTFALGNLALDFPDDLQVGRNMSEEDIHAVLQHAANEHRLEGESLTASAGWCAPSEQLYDLPNNEVVDGMLSVPEVQVNRGGFKHTTGLDWATLYAGVGFLQTEAQAQAGTAKTFYEVPCPTFTDERLDAIGLGIKVPILLEAGYPEQVQNVMARSMVAHQYKVNASVVSRIVTAAGTARNFTSDLGSYTIDTLSGVDLVLEQLRQKWRIGSNTSIEVVFPMFARSLFRNDLGSRTARPTDAVTDAEIMAHFAVRKANVQFIYGYQELTTTDVAWPTNVNFLAYPSGTFVKGVSNVINLSAVYDAASLAVNIYTGLFFEQGLLVAKMNFEAINAVVPVNISGRTGAANLT